MQVRKLFKKPIDRPINGVVKADQLDESTIWQELDEFVVTRELDQHLRRFFSTYVESIDQAKNSEIAGKIGVWVSGFFGSGKSHFIKILSYLLKNDPHHHKGDSKLAVDFFERKIQDALLFSDIKRAVAAHTDVILFNIDSKADTKAGRDAILTVFLKVLNEMQGFCPDHPHIAHMERYLQAKGKLAEFQQAFEKASGSKWKEERDAYQFHHDHVVEAWSAATGQSKEAAEKWIDKAEENFSLTIENFCKWVKEYLDQKGKDHRIIFLVDEVGQFIGGDTHLMLNLQTITEDLGTMCGGRAWVVVTSQEDIDAVLGDLRSTKSHDFSKIQGRFKTRLSLSSANVDEVIQERLLAKVEEDGVKEKLEAIFKEKGDILRNQLSFHNVGMTFKQYKDADDFCRNYPFAPYQFQLVQRIFEAIRKAGATGLHLSRGERSILDAFQSAGTAVADCEVNVLVPLYRFYPSIDSFLDTAVKRTIDQAKDNASLKPFDIEVLRVLFLIRYLLGSHCASNDEQLIQDGLQTVKKILSENYVRPDESEKVKSVIRERGSYKIIDKVTVALNERRDVYEAQLLNLGVTGAEIPTSFIKKYEKLLAGGIWSIITMQYYFEEGQRGSPFIVEDVKPIQMPGMDMEELFKGRREFTEDQWIDVLLRSCGYEPTQFEQRVKWHILCRMIPLVENNFNVCELGPRGTGKSHIYKEISPNSILISGGNTTVANLFYNLSSKSVGLVGLWDVVAFDEVAGIVFRGKDKDALQIMKDYMASGSFARGRDAISASAAMVFVGNINQPVDTLVKTSHLLAPFPEAMIDSAFFDRFHAYIPGWEIPKMRPEFFTNQYGLIVDYLAEWVREMRKRNFGDAITKYFRLGRDLNQRDTIAVRHTVSGLLKLLYPEETYDKEAVRRCLEYALETRRRVKEQLKKIGGMEFFDVHFSYIDVESLEEKFINVPEQGGGGLIPDGPLNPGVMHTVAIGSGGHLGLYRIETQVTPGNGSLKMSGFGSNSQAKEAVKVGFDYFKANSGHVSASIKALDHDYHLHVVELHNTGATTAMTLSAFVALCSAVLGKPIQSQMVVLGSMSLGGSVIPVENLAESLQVAHDSGAKRILLPMASVRDIPTIPGELFAKFQTSFYADPRDAAFKALGVE